MLMTMTANTSTEGLSEWHMSAPSATACRDAEVGSKALGPPHNTGPGCKVSELICKS